MPDFSEYIEKNYGKINLLTLKHCLDNQTMEHTYAATRAKEEYKLQ